MTASNGSAATEPTSCYCGATGATLLLRGADLRLGSPGAYSVLRCERCGTVRTNPRPLDPGSAYPPEEYYSHQEPRESFFGRLRARAVRSRYEPAGSLGDRLAGRLLATRVGGLPDVRGRVLDVGAGNGETLALLARAGFEVAGIEPSPQAAAHARARGLDVHAGTLDDHPYPSESFDTVRFWHVLEHVADPLAALRSARALVRPGGTLILGVPNFASVVARTSGSRWYHLDLPRHLYHFEPATIRRLLGRAGFRVGRVTHASGGGLAGTLENGVADWRRFSPRLVDRVSVVLALAPAEWALDALGQGEALDVRATPS